MGTDALLDLVDHTFGTTTSLVSIATLNLIFPLLCFGIVLTRWLATRRRLRQAEAQTANAVLGSGGASAGPAAFMGRVELTPGNDLAFQVRIEQAGRQIEKEGRVSHVWSETRREVSWAPFYLTDGGRRLVLVDPARETELVDEPSRTIAQSPTLRTRVIELTPGEEIFAVGELGAPSAPNEPPVLQAPAGAKLLLSSRPLAECYRGWTRFHLAFVVLFAVLLLLAGLFHTPFFLRLAQGESGEGRIVALETGRWSGSKGSRSSCIITVERPDGFRMSAELNRAIDKSSYDKNACENFVAIGDRIPIVFVRGQDGVDQFGRQPGAHGAVVISIAALAIVGFALHLLLPRLFPGRAERLDESGSGPLTA